MSPCSRPTSLHPGHLPQSQRSRTGLLVASTMGLLFLLTSVPLPEPPVSGARCSPGDLWGNRGRTFPKRELGESQTPAARLSPQADHNPTGQTRPTGPRHDPYAVQRRGLSQGQHLRGRQAKALNPPGSLGTREGGTTTWLGVDTLGPHPKRNKGGNVGSPTGWRSQEQPSPSGAQCPHKTSHLRLTYPCAQESTGIPASQDYVTHPHPCCHPTTTNRPLIRTLRPKERARVTQGAGGMGERWMAWAHTEPSSLATGAWRSEPAPLSALQTGQFPRQALSPGKPWGPLRGVPAWEIPQ